MCDKMAISAYILKIVEKDPYSRLQMRAKDFDKWETAEISEIFSPTSLDIQLSRRVTDPGLPQAIFGGSGGGGVWGPK